MGDEDMMQWLFNEIIISKAFVIVVLVIMVSVIAYAIYKVHETSSVMKKLKDMLDHAANGTFNASEYNESLFSSVENQFSKYIASSERGRIIVEEERNRIKALISDISHQTKTPLANLQLYSQLISEQLQESGQSEQLEAIRAVQNQTHKLNFLIDMLIKLSRLEAGIIKLSPCIADVMPLLSELKLIYEPIAETKGIALSIIPTEDKAIFDKKWTLEALGNVVDNAIKYTPAGGRIMISVAAFELFIAINVTDDGMGVDEAEHANIFTRFYRSMDAASVDGLGIGLFLTRQILSEQNGYIKLKSSKGNGATFSIYLPKI